jgi:hypothetical protein
VEVITDKAATPPGPALGELLPAAWHRTDRYANKRAEYDHDRFKARLRPMLGLKQDHSARVIIAVRKRSGGYCLDPHSLSIASDVTDRGGCDGLRSAALTVRLGLRCGAWWVPRIAR